MSWRHDAACAGLDPAWFFPERGEMTKQAKTVCEECPVRAPCLIDALATREVHGIRGGLSERQRRRLRQLPEWADGAGHRCECGANLARVNAQAGVHRCSR